MAAVPGSLFRRSLFWAHLACGIAAGILILAMSVTGTLLTYERQIVESRAAGNRLSIAPGELPLPADRLAELARAAAPEGARISLVFDADPEMPVTAALGRDETLLLHPVTGAVIDDAATGARGFFRVVEDWHRWLGGDPRSTRANLLDIANLLFLFIIVSGIYLWLPAVWRWRTLRGLMLFRRSYVNSKVRDFNWHHAFSFWMLVPLFLIALSGVVISYPWASNLVYAAFGEQPPQRGGPGGPGGGPPRGSEGALGADTPRASVEAQLQAAKSQFANWQRITLPVAATGPTVDITAELQSDAARPPRQTLTLNAANASVVRLSPPPAAASATQSPGQRARVWFRFIHTGEQYGVIGQTLAGLASLAACFLVYTGLALAWRRLIVPVFRGS